MIYRSASIAFEFYFSHKFCSQMFDNQLPQRWFMFAKKIETFHAPVKLNTLDSMTYMSFDHAVVHNF